MYRIIANQSCFQWLLVHTFDIACFVGFDFYRVMRKNQVLDVKLNSRRFSSPKLICFEGKMNHTINQSIFLHFLLLFPISPATGKFHDDRTRCLSRQSIHSSIFRTSSWLEKYVRKCVLHQPEEMVIRRCHVWRVRWMREDFSFKL